MIVGAGLGGCFLADALAQSYDVHMVELASQSPYFLQGRIRDTDTAAVTYPHIGTGLGGTTAFWHNGLIEIDAEVFDRQWPFSKDELDPYYEVAYPKLAGLESHLIRQQVEVLRAQYERSGLPETRLGLGLFYPRERINAWKLLDIKDKVMLVDGEVIDIVANKASAIEYLLVKSGDREIRVTGDVFVLAAGGLGTPLLLQKLAKNLPMSALTHAGAHYEDHPTVVVGELVLDEPLYQLWNYPVAKGNLRLPIVVQQDGLLVSFQLRPSAHFWIINPRNRVKSVLHELRNEPFNLRNYLKLLTRWDDVMEILSFKFGIRLPTRHYSLVMVAEQSPSDTRAVWRDGTEVCRQWIMSSDYIDTLQKSIQNVLGLLKKKIRTANIFPDWPQHIASSSHHSGTARMAKSADAGVCDSNGQVHGINNLFICDGSAIPATGYANTGLTIAALGIRMARYLQSRAVKGVQAAKNDKVTHDA